MHHSQTAVWSLQATWVEHCKKTGRTFAPNPGHTCTALCQWYRRNEAPGLSLCCESGNVHVCGPGVCNRVTKQESGSTETPVCSLTGRLLRSSGVCEAWRMRVEWMRKQPPTQRIDPGHVCGLGCGWVRGKRDRELFLCSRSGFVHRCGPGSCRYTKDPSKTYAIRAGNTHNECNPGWYMPVRPLSTTARTVTHFRDPGALICELTGNEVCGNLVQKTGFKDLAHTNTETSVEERKQRKRKPHTDPVGSQVDRKEASLMCKTRFVDTPYRPDADTFQQMSDFCGIVRLFGETTDHDLPNNREQTATAIAHCFKNLARVRSMADFAGPLMETHRWINDLKPLTNSESQHIRQAKKRVELNKADLVEYFEKWFVGN